MKLRLTTLLFICYFFLLSCGSDDENSEPEGLELGPNEVVFSDDNIICTPFFGTPTISGGGILSVIMNPCQSSSSKLDGYFASRPTAGSYTVIGTAGEFPNITSISANAFTMVFYNHYPQELYSTSGTVEISVNADDDTKLDMVWNNVTMEAADGYSVEFSGRFVGI